MGDRTIILDLAGCGVPDAGLVDALALIQLAAKRAGVELRLQNGDRALAELIAFMGLSEALRIDPLR